MMDDILIRTDPAGNIKADKEKSIEKFENETVQQTYAKVKNLITRSCEISDFSYDLFVSKINAINSILANQTLCDLNQKPEEDNKKNQKLEAEIEELQKLKDSASQRAKDIKDVVEELAKDEYEKVGPALGKFYNKLIRFNSSDGINIVQDLLMKDFQNEDICGQHKNRIGCSFL